MQLFMIIYFSILISITIYAWNFYKSMITWIFLEIFFSILEFIFHHKLINWPMTKNDHNFSFYLLM